MKIRYYLSIIGAGGIVIFAGMYVKRGLELDNAQLKLEASQLSLQQANIALRRSVSAYDELLEQRLYIEHTLLENAAQRDRERSRAIGLERQIRELKDEQSKQWKEGEIPDAIKNIINNS